MEEPQPSHYQEAIVRCGTTKGTFSLRLIRKWSPLGYDRAVSLFQRGFYDHTHFFRTVHGFLVQFGISYTTDPALRKFGNTHIRDDPQLDPPILFDEGVVSFAGGGQDTRTSQLFIAYGKIPSLGQEVWEVPIGQVIEGMENVRNFEGKYGDMPPWGNGPEQSRIHEEGSKYMEENYPLMDKFETCTVEIVFPNLLDYDDRDLKEPADVKKEPMGGMGLPEAAGEAKVDTGGNTATLQIRAASSTDPNKVPGYRESGKATSSIVVAIIALFFMMICLLRGKKKREDKKS